MYLVGSVGRAVPLHLRVADSFCLLALLFDLFLLLFGIVWCILNNITSSHVRCKVNKVSYAKVKYPPILKEVGHGQKLYLFYYFLYIVKLSFWRWINIHGLKTFTLVFLRGLMLDCLLDKNNICLFISEEVFI